MELLSAIIEKSGGATKLAAHLDITYGAVMKWRERQSKIPAQYVLSIEKLTGVSRHVMRPDVFGEAE